MSQGTPHRSVRVEDELWNAAQEAAKENGDNLSDVIRDGLRRYVEETQGMRTTHAT